VEYTWFVRFVLATWGSFGDLHPFLAIGKGLLARGHHVTICTGSLYREKVVREGLDFAALRPELPPPEDSAALLERLMDPKHGSRRVLTEWMMPALDDQRADLSASLEDGDFLLTHPILYAAPVAARDRNVPWATGFLSPILLPSAFDLPIPPSHPDAGWIHQVRPPFSRWILEAGKARVRSWAAAADTLRASVGLPDVHPLFEGMHSPLLNLALFSRVLASPQPDWPRSTVQTGFPFYDRLLGGEEDRLDGALEAFLQNGPPPLLFTLGSSAVMTPGRFFTLAVDAVQTLGRRAVLLTGKGVPLPQGLPPSVLAVPYAPHSLLMPRCAGIVHQGGVGTTGQALRSGRPQLVVPFSHDQPDNAWRITRAGAGTTLPIGKLRRSALRDALAALPAAAPRAEELGTLTRAEDGVSIACDALERAISEPA
jgi:UDP:flavonoid glycosyltransferase YjiC (YdhE family)